MGDAGPAVRAEVEIGAPADAVWAWLTEPGLARRWFGWEHDALDDEIDLILVDAIAVSRERLRLQTNGCGLLTLEDRGERTVVRLTRPELGPDADPDAPDAIDEGWRTFLAALRLGLERAPDAERRSAAVAGRAVAAGGPGLADALGLGAATALPVGARYAAPGPGAVELAGEVLSRADGQLALTVDAWGPGLVVLVDRPPALAPPHGGAQVVLSAFGLDDAAFAAVTAAWTAAVRGAFPADA